MIFLLLLFVTIQTMPTAALAIINAEDLDLSLDTDGVSGKLEASLSGSAGNSNKQRGQRSGRVIWRHAQHLDMLVGSFSYGKSRGVRDTKKSFAHLRHRYALNHTWGLEGFLQAQQDEFARLKLRLLLGGGLRWSYQYQAWEWHIGLGSFYERETLRAVANIAALSHVWRGNSYLALRYAFDKWVRFQDTLYYQPVWKDSADYRLLNDVALHVALTDHLDLKLVLEIAQDSRPPTGVKRTDINYKTGLSFRF